MKTQCKFSTNYNYNKLISVWCIGPNGNSILLSCNGYKEQFKTAGNNECYFWIKGTLDEDDNTSTSANIFEPSGVSTKYIEEQMFTGYSLPIRLVR